MFQRPPQIIGLDVGHYCLKATVVEKTAEGLTLRSYATQVRGDETLEKSLRKLLRKLKTGTRLCAVAFWTPESVLRFAERRVEDRSDIRSWIQQEDLAGYLLDYSDSGPSLSNPGFKRILICGSPRQQVTELISTLEKAGLKITLLQLMPIALFNAFHGSRGENTQSFRLLDIGFKQSYFCAGQAGQILLLRAISWGASHFQETLRSKGIEDFSTAESFHLRTAIQEAGQPLFAELRKNEDFLQKEDFSGFRFQMPEVESESIYLSGYLGGIPEFGEAITRNCFLPCNVWNPFQKVSATEKALADFKLLNELPRLPAAAGAAFQFLA